HIRTAASGNTTPNTNSVMTPLRPPRRTKPRTPDPQRAAQSRRAHRFKRNTMSIAQYQDRAEQLLTAAGILPVVTVHTLDQARAVSAALLEGGLPAIELTLRTPVAMEALAMLKRELPDVVVGAGTVLTVEQMQR